MQRFMKQRGVQVIEGSGVARVDPGLLTLQDGSTHAFDECLWCTQASAASWLKDTGRRWLF